VARRLTGLALAIAVTMPGAWAEALPDPTRPPAAVDAPETGAADAGALVLQSVILGKGRKPSAIIGGQRVDLNGMVGDARLVHVSETEAVLEGPAGRQVLKMTPDAVKRQTPDDTRTRRAAARSPSSPLPSSPLP
jgi:MSHA biogenesis protein MshK